MFFLFQLRFFAVWKGGTWNRQVYGIRVLVLALTSLRQSLNSNDAINHKHKFRLGLLRRRDRWLTLVIICSQPASVVRFENCAHYGTWGVSPSPRSRVQQHAIHISSAIYIANRINANWTRKNYNWLRARRDQWAAKLEHRARSLICSLLLQIFLDYYSSKYAMFKL